MSMGDFLADLQDLAAGTVTIEPWVSVDAYNQASYGAGVSVMAQLSGPVTFWHRESSALRVSGQTVYLFTDSPVSAKDRITLAGFDADTSTPKIMQVDRYSDELGFCYTRLTLG